MEIRSKTRRFDLDWLRVIAILTVFVFHSLRLFDFDDWHVKNAQHSAEAALTTRVLNLWIMPMVFVISGASIFYAFEKGKAGKFVWDKTLRLAAPLVVNVFSLCMVQVYLERITHHQFNGSIIDFLPHYFHGIYGLEAGGNFALVGMHLWYLAVLFVFCVLLLPVFIFFTSKGGEQRLGKVMDFLGIPGLAYLLFIPIPLCENMLDENSILGFSRFNWNLGIYMWCFLSGYMIMASQKLQNSIQKLRWVSLAIAAAATVVSMLTDDVLEDVAMWFGVMSFLGFGMKYLNTSSPFLHYANQVVLPFYILHQTVLLCTGFFVVQWQVPIFVKWVVNSTLTLAVILLLYEWVIRRFNILRFLFGMKALKRQEARPISVLPVKHQEV